MFARPLSLVWIATVVAIAVSASSAPLDWMAEAEINDTFKGRSIDGHYDDGDAFHEAFGADGRVSYSDRRRQSGGRWSVEAGTLCTIYDDDPAGGCYRVRRESENCYEFYFVARTEFEVQHGPRKPAWTARGWLADRPTTCIAGESV